MKIGIYGDSFVEYNSAGHEYQWVTMLGKKIADGTVTNYGLSGTSVFYSYKQFLNNYHKHDINIFLVTNPNRYTKPIIDVEFQQKIFIGTLNGFEDYKEKNIKKLSSFDIKILDDIMGWYRSTDEEFAVTASELMINHVQELDNKVILFPCFEESFTETQYKKYGISKEYVMFNYIKRAKKLLNLDLDVLVSEVTSTIAQHLTPEFNEFVADFMHKKIITGIWDFSNFENIKLEHPREYYYK